MNTSWLRKTKYTLLSLLFFVSITTCTQNPAEKIEKGVELYNNGETSKGIKLIEDGVIKFALIKKIKLNQLFQGENVLYYRQKKNLIIVWPLEVTIEIPEKYNLISYFPDENKFGLSDGNNIKLYNTDGDLLKTCGPTPDDNRIKAFTIVNGLIYYYKDKNVFIYDPATDTEKQLSNKKTKLPLDNESYNARFYKTDKRLAAVAGIAGRYYLSVYDLKNNYITLANQNIASLKLLFQNDDIYYSSGSAGKYLIVKKSITSKKQKNLMELNNLKDLEFLKSGILIEDKDGLWFAGYENEKQKIPFHYEPFGQYSGDPVIKYSKNFFLIDAVKFADILARIKEKAPSVLENR